MQEMFFSKSAGGFFTPTIHSNMPDDVVPVPDDEYQMLITSGKRIVGNSAGNPVMVDTAEVSSLSRVDAEQMLTTLVNTVSATCAKRKHYASMEEACSFREGPFAEDGRFFRDLRDLIRTHKLDLISKLVDEQPMEHLQAMVQDIQNAADTFMAEYEAKGKVTPNV